MAEFRQKGGLKWSRVRLLEMTVDSPEVPPGVQDQSCCSHLQNYIDGKKGKVPKSVCLV